MKKKKKREMGKTLSSMSLLKIVGEKLPPSQRSSLDSLQFIHRLLSPLAKNYMVGSLKTKTACGCLHGGVIELKTKTECGCLHGGVIENEDGVRLPTWLGSLN